MAFSLITVLSSVTLSAEADPTGYVPTYNPGETVHLTYYPSSGYSSVHTFYLTPNVIANAILVEGPRTVERAYVPNGYSWPMQLPTNLAPGYYYLVAVKDTTDYQNPGAIWEEYRQVIKVPRASYNFHIRVAWADQVSEAIQGNQAWVDFTLDWGSPGDSPIFTIPNPPPVTFTVQGIPGNPSVTWTKNNVVPISGSTLKIPTGNIPVGSYTVTITGTGGGVSRSTTFTLKVLPPPDSTPPVITTPGAITVDAQSPAGATVTYSVSAWDAVAGNVPVSSSPPSGSFFPMGTTTVSCSSSDGHGNTAYTSFTVTVAVPDDDLDMIWNNADTAPSLPSIDFEDTLPTGLLEGSILMPGDQSLAIWNNPDPLGIGVLSYNTGATEPALLNLQEGMVNVWVSNGDSLLLSLGSTVINVINGPVVVEFNLAGLTKTIVLYHGTYILDDDGYKIVNVNGSPDIEVDDVPYYIPAGSELYLTEPPEAYIAGPYTTDEGVSILIQDAASHTGTGKILVDFQWDLGDGSFSSGLEVNHVYMDDGVYTVTLTVTDNVGMQDTATTTVTVNDRAPVAHFTGHEHDVPEGVPRQFSDYSSSWPDEIVAWFWDFAGIGTSTEENPWFTFMEDGTYHVTLTVTDEDGSTSSVTHDLTVLDLSPEADFTWTPAPQEEGMIVQFSDLSTSYPDSIVAWSWDFAGIGASSDPNPLFIFIEDGNYLVTLTVTDSDGSESSRSHEVMIVDRSPEVDFTWYPEPQYEGASIQFTDSSKSYPDFITGYSWDFGGLGASSQKNPAYTFMDDGVLPVTLTVFDVDSSASLTHMVTVLDLGPTAEVSGDTSLPEGSMGNYNALGSVSYPDEISSYEWDWGYDGVFTPSGDLGVIQSHTWLDDGLYTVAVRVTDDDGSIDIATMEISVTDLSPVAEFNGWDHDWIEGVPDSFFDVSYSWPDTLTDWYWEFGDELFGVGPSPSHVFGDDGGFTVTLTVTDEDGSQDTVSHTVTVQDVNPVADFIWDYSKAKEGTVLAFIDLSHGNPCDLISAWYWDFGDGATSDNPLPAHVYVEDGDYTVTLTVYDEDSSTTISKLVTIENIAPYIDSHASVVDTPVDEGSPINLVAVFKDPGAEDTHTATVDWSDGPIIGYPPEPIIVGDGGGSLAGTHTYGDNGVNTVTVTVTDDDGGVGILELTVIVLNVPPTVTISGPESAYEGDEVWFTGSFTDPGWLDTHALVWDFGDGTEPVQDETGTLLGVSHTYGDNGVYTVTLSVEDDDGDTGVASYEIHVMNVAPTVIAGESVIGMRGEPITISGTFTDPGWLDTHIAQIDWGDGTSSPGTVDEDNGDGSVTGTHTYEDGIEFTVTITVTDDDGDSNIDQLTVKLSPKCMKEEAINILESNLGLYDEHVDRDIEQAIWHIQKSLNPILWVDGVHLSWQHGNKVFDEEKLAVKDLLHIIEMKNPPQAAVDMAYEVIDLLVEADSWLASIQYQDATAIMGTSKTVDHQLDLAQEWLDNAATELTTLKKGHPKYDDAINAFNLAWQHSGLAIQQAQKK